jgi:hypothetical protein
MALASLLLIPLIAITGFQVSPAKPEIPYRLLKVVKPPDPDNAAARRIGYFISVQNFLDKPAVESLICAMIEREKPTKGMDFLIAVFQGLETITTIDLVFGGEVYEHDLATYNWSPAHGSLSILRDPKGMRFIPPKIYDFNHVESCPNR